MLISLICVALFFKLNNSWKTLRCFYCQRAVPCRVYCSAVVLNFPSVHAKLLVQVSVKPFSICFGKKTAIAARQALLNWRRQVMLLFFFSFFSMDAPIKCQGVVYTRVRLLACLDPTLICFLSNWLKAEAWRDEKHPLAYLVVFKPLQFNSFNYVDCTAGPWKLPHAPNFFFVCNCRIMQLIPKKQE